MNRHQSRWAALAVTLLFAQPALGVDLWYDFEGDTDAAIDKLPLGGQQNGTFFGDVTVLGPGGNGGVLFGDYAALFEVPEPVSPVNPPFSTIEIPGTDSLGASYTLAMHASLTEADPGRTRLFSSYAGTGGVGADDILVDFAPSVGIRAFVGGESVASAGIPAGLGDPGYHHYALTVNNGDVRLYFNGGEVASSFVLGSYSSAVNVLVGEDVGGTANEQLVGNVDDILAIDQALSAADIALLAGGSSVQSLVTPTGSYAVNYDFEGDSGTNFTDKFVADGSQNGIATLLAEVDPNPANAGVGVQSAVLGNAVPANKFSQIDTGVSGDLGDQLTLSAVINVPEWGGHAGGGLARLFSNYRGSGSPSGQFLIDFNPDADVANIGVRWILPDGTSVVSNDPFEAGVDHTITAVYDQGDVRLYMDGVEIASGTTSGSVDIGEATLRIGEDVAGSLNENFIGVMDDVLILSRALNPTQVERLSQLGAAVVIPEPASLGLTVLAGLLSLAAVGRRRLA